MLVQSRGIWAFALAVGLSSGGSAWLGAQTGRTNPLESNAEAVRRGSLLYRARCAGCHGLDARGVSGPDLTAVLSGGLGDERFFRTVRSGQGTDMPRFGPEQTADTQVWEILAHLRSVSRGASTAAPSGNAQNGKRLFQQRCASCHRVDGTGGALGPDLSRIGAVRSPSALAAKVRDPNTSALPGYRPVTVVLRDGRKIQGVIKNEDAFSIQIMDLGQEIRGFLKSDIRELVREDRSAMPAFAADRLNDSDLADLVTHLAALRRSGASAQ
jgi:putative heme-binding domain-containing protein